MTLERTIGWGEEQPSRKCEGNEPVGNLVVASFPLYAFKNCRNTRNDIEPNAGLTASLLTQFIRKKKCTLSEKNALYVG